LVDGWWLAVVMMVVMVEEDCCLLAAMTQDSAGRSAAALDQSLLAATSRELREPATLSSSNVVAVRCDLSQPQPASRLSLSRLCWK